MRRPFHILVLAVSAAVLGGALLLQYAGGLVPCELCLQERWPYLASLLLAALVLAARRPWLSSEILPGYLVIFLVSAGLGLHHVLVEWHWIQGPTACTGDAGGATTIEQLTAQILQQEPVRCDQVQWSFLGLSLAGWNTLISVGLAFLTTRQMRRHIKVVAP